MNKDYPVRGLADIDKFFAALPKKMETGGYRAALTAAADPIQKEARERVRRKSGKTAKAIKKGSARKNPDGTFSISIRLTGSHAFIGWFLERGVLPHLIARAVGGGRGRVALKKAAADGQKIGGVLKIGDEFVSGIISHPGHTAHPFMRPALDVKAEEAIKAFADRFRSYLEDKTGFAAPIDEAA